jgi:hypothetical protein
MAAKVFDSSSTLVRRILASLILVGAFLTSSCKPNAGAVVPVSGRVLVDRKPAERALVVLHPVASTSDDQPKPHGEVKPDGTFQLSTYGSNDGAPPGDYVVTIEWWLHSGKPGDDSPPVNKLAKKYSSPQLSGLKAHVGDGPTELQPYELSR